MMVQPHFLLVTYPAQGHINPSLQLAKGLTRIGVLVTLVTSLSAGRRMSKTSFPDGLSFVTYSDGYDDGLEPGGDLERLASELKRRGSQTLNELTWHAHSISQQHFFGFSLQLSLTSITITSMAMAISSIIARTRSYVIELPGLPPLTSRDLPSFTLPSNTYTVILRSFQEQLEHLSQEPNPRVLVNSFDALELGPMNATEKFKLIGIGPLIPSAFLDGKDPLDRSFGGDLFRVSEDYTEWLNSKTESSVVYVSFGSILVLSKRQVEEVARGLVDSGFPFLWILRDEQNKNGEEEDEEGGHLSACREAILEGQGKIVPWCCQVEVLSHPSTGCFVTHCGWNSTLESLVSEVPVVAFPHWTDQGTNAKLVADVWKTGVRVVANEEGIVEGDEIKRCLDLVMSPGKTGEEIRKNAGKWKDLARDAVREGGSSDKNLRAFVREVDGGCF
ncbi:hypothetical protein OIU77_024363 [Salix suchowensis]|uniref:Glycosyltransferase n=1 Tax=Salix suchowensis TaxID=1278906 RepID=A0ABQ9BSN4_9ROSI|nr:hypothetical protein OIU77_024363 [Salix suchowensis]